MECKTPLSDETSCVFLQSVPVRGAGVGGVAGGWGDLTWENEGRQRTEVEVENWTGTEMLQDSTCLETNAYRWHQCGILSRDVLQGQMEKYASSCSHCDSCEKWIPLSCRYGDYEATSSCWLVQLLGERRSQWARFCQNVKKSAHQLPWNQ